MIKHNENNSNFYSILLFCIMHSINNSLYNSCTSSIILVVIAIIFIRPFTETNRDKMKPGDKVIIINKNLKHYEIDGDVTHVNEIEKRIRVQFGVFGEWGFNYSDVKPIGKQPNTPQNKPTEAIKPKETGIVLTEKIKAVKSTEKRPYTKRGSKPVDDKPKRKYSQRKPKTI